jgi:hypothetical protein
MAEKAKFRDLRNPLAKARDKFFESLQGDALTVGMPGGQYLRNRLEAAFIAGWNACEIGPRPRKRKSNG